MTQPKNLCIASRIPVLLAKLPPQTADKFRQSFETQDDLQSEHTFRELVLGAWLASLPSKIEHERRMDNGQTPDWTLLDDQDKPIGIVEVTTTRPDPEAEKVLVAALDKGKRWSGWPPDAAPRLARSIRRKVEKYRSLLTTMALPYAVAVFGHTLAFIDEEDLRTALFILDGGVFASAPELSGVLFFEETGGQYSFRYFLNPAARFLMPLIVD